MLGRFDVIDIVEASDVRQVERAALIIRAYGHASTETMPATPWSSFIGEL
ncbi:MAG: GYD domain-containing protein [Terriglobales bacterium]